MKTEFKERIENYLSGRHPVYTEIYKSIEHITNEKALVISCETIEERKKIYGAVKSYLARHNKRTVSMFTDPDNSLNLYIQERLHNGRD